MLGVLPDVHRLQRRPAMGVAAKTGSSLRMLRAIQPVGINVICSANHQLGGSRWFHSGGVMTPATFTAQLRAALVVAVAMAVACLRGFTPVAAQQPPSWAYPDATRTGLAEVDRAIAEMLERDHAGLLGRFVFTARPCSTAGGIGSVRCPVGQPSGTSVHVFRSVSCQSSWLPQGDPALEAAAQQLVSHPKALFAVARVSGDATGADFAVFFGGYSDPGTPEVEGTDDSARVLYVSEAGISGVDFGCRDGVGHEAASLSASAFLLPPRVGPLPPILGSGPEPEPTPSRAGRLALVLLALGSALLAITRPRRDTPLR